MTFHLDLSKLGLVKSSKNKTFLFDWAPNCICVIKTQANKITNRNIFRDLLERFIVLINN